LWMALPSLLTYSIVLHSVQMLQATVSVIFYFLYSDQKPKRKISTSTDLQRHGACTVNAWNVVLLRTCSMFLVCVHT
jgi:hypothetical protein